MCGVLACLLLVFSGYASGSEIAFFSLSPNDLNELDEEKNDDDRQITELREDSERTLATILITNNLVNVTIIMLCNYFFSHVIDFGNAYWLQFIVITVLLTFLLLLFGEIMPKVYAAQHALAFCRFSASGIMRLRTFFYPLASVLIRSGVLAEKVVQKENHVLSVDDLEQALELTGENELKDEKDMLLTKAIVEFAASDECGNVVINPDNTREQLGGARGNATSSGEINLIDDQYIQFPTAVHELTHQLRHWAFASTNNPALKRFYYRNSNRDIREQEADLCSAFVSYNFGYSIQSRLNYLQNWGLTKDNVNEVFNQIADLAQYIENGVQKYMNKIIN